MGKSDMVRVAEHRGYLRLGQESPRAPTPPEEYYGTVCFWVHLTEDKRVPRRQPFYVLISPRRNAVDLLNPPKKKVDLEKLGFTYIETDEHASGRLCLTAPAKTAGKETTPFNLYVSLVPLAGYNYGFDRFDEVDWDYGFANRLHTFVVNPEYEKIYVGRINAGLRLPKDESPYLARQEPPKVPTKAPAPPPMVPPAVPPKETPTEMGTYVMVAGAAFFGGLLVFNAIFGKD